MSTVILARLSHLKQEWQRVKGAHLTITCSKQMKNTIIKSHVGL